MNPKPLMGYNEIVKILPHRHPFILLDRVLEIQRGNKAPSQVGDRVRALKNVTINEPYFQGHFPHRPVMPGVFILEVMAQVGAILSHHEGEPPKDVAFVGVNEARFRRPVIPGDQLIIDVECIKDRGQMFVFASQVYVDSLLVAEAEILAKVFPIVI